MAIKQAIYNFTTGISRLRCFPIQVHLRPLQSTPYPPHRIAPAYESGGGKSWWVHSPPGSTSATPRCTTHPNIWFDVSIPPFHCAIRQLQGQRQLRVLLGHLSEGHIRLKCLQPMKPIGDRIVLYGKLMRNPFLLRPLSNFLTTEPLAATVKLGLKKVFRKNLGYPCIYLEYIG